MITSNINIFLIRLHLIHPLLIDDYNKKLSNKLGFTFFTIWFRRKATGVVVAHAKCLEKYK